MSVHSANTGFRLLALCACSVWFGLSAYAAAPTIIAFTPAAGPVGTVLTITVANYTQEPAVQLNGTAAAVNSVTLTATVAPGTTTGPLSVTTPNGTAVSATNFTVLQAPISTATPGTASADGVVAMVGGRQITEKEIMKELKHQGGDLVLMQMISDELLGNYARQRGVTVTDEEIDQFIKFQQASLELHGETIDKLLADHGQSMADLRKSLKMTLLQIKLIVPDDDIKAALVQYSEQLTLPKRYRLRDFTYDSEDLAKKALVSLHKPDGLQEGAVMASNATTALDVQTIASKDFQTGFPAGYAALTPLKPGDFSAPIAMKGKGFHVIQLLEIVPEEKATLKNRGAVMGQQLISEGQGKYQGKIEALKADALAKVETQILSADYPQAQQMLQEMRLHNPAASGTPAAPGVPGGQ